MLQLAFDFYDSNNDDNVTEFDIFKVLHYYGREKNTLFSQSIQADILILL